jgi:NADH dehydrogenase FAD-containing subunit
LKGSHILSKENARFSVATRPISELLWKIERFEANFEKEINCQNIPSVTDSLQKMRYPRVVVIGAGAAGIELAFAFQFVFIYFESYKQND